MKFWKQRSSKAWAIGVFVAISAPGIQGQDLDQETSRSTTIPVFADSGNDISVLRSARDALMQASDYVAALGPAENIVASAPAQSTENYPMDILRLAQVQSELGLHEEAEVNYLNGIELIEERDGQNATSLIYAYQSLGRNYLNNRRFNEAITVLEIAQGVSQRNAGLFNVEQASIIDDITMALLGIGDTREAQRLQLERLGNAVRRFGDDDPRMIPYHDHLGDYYNSSRLRTSAREQYQKILELQAQQVGVDADDQALLLPLRKLVHIELLLGDDDSAKQRLSETLNRSPDLDSTERGLSLALLGDWAIVSEDFILANDYYAQAYAALADSNEIMRDELFAAPKMIDFIPPLNSVDRGRRSDPYAWGSIVMRFDLSASGRASNVKTAALTPPGQSESAYSRRLRETHFRPKLASGVPVATSDLEFTHFFRYYVRD